MDNMKNLYRHYILESLRDWYRTNREIRRIINLPQEMEKLSRRSDNPLRKDSIDRALVNEIVNDLFIERIVDIINNDNVYTFLDLRLDLTSFGKEIMENNDVTPTDKQYYFSYLQDEIPDLDDVIIKYLEESVEAYNRRLLLSSTITLGCASEKALLLLIDAYVDAITDTAKKSRFTEKVKGRMIKRQFEEFNKKLPEIVRLLPDEISDGLENILKGVFEMIRNNRNDVGHPTGKIITREHAFSYHRLFIAYCKRIYDLIHWFESNPIQ